MREKKVIEKQFMEHQRLAHGSKTNANCPFCRAYKNKVKPPIKERTR